MDAWKFFGRELELVDLQSRIARNQFFLIRVSGRRRIGKTALVKQAFDRTNPRRMAYIQVIDADPPAVIVAPRRHLQLSGIDPTLLPHDLASLAACLARLAERGYIVVFDEFQYFHRKALFEFTSHLQFEVDRFRLQQGRTPGGIILLGSLQTEMAALLDDRRSPLFGRVTGSIERGHLPIGTLHKILNTLLPGRARTSAAPPSLLPDRAPTSAASPEPAGEYPESRALRPGAACCALSVAPRALVGHELPLSQALVPPELPLAPNSSCLAPSPRAPK